MQDKRAGDSAPQSEPSIHVLYAEEGFIPTKPPTLEDGNHEIIFNWGGVKIIRVSPTLVLKCGAHVSIMEAKSLMFVAQHAPTAPMPRVHAFYTYGPFDRDPDDYGSIYDYCIVMDFIEGQTLEQAWSSLTTCDKTSLVGLLKQHIDKVRATEGPSTLIGSVEYGPVTDIILRYKRSRGPFESEKEFHETLVDEYLRVMKAPEKRCSLIDQLSPRRHRVVFTHGDLRRANILIANGKISGIIDWELSGWYPEYWEYAKAMYTCDDQDDWVEHIAHMLEPYHQEQRVHALLADLI